MCFKEIQKNIHNIHCHCREDGRLDTGFCVTHKEHLTDRRDEHGRKDTGKEYIKNWLELSFQSHLPELQLYARERNIFEWNYIKQSVKNDSTVSFHKKIIILVLQQIFLINMKKIFLILYFSQKNRTCTLVQNLTDGILAADLLIKPHTLLCIKQSVLERSNLHVVYIESLQSEIKSCKSPENSYRWETI